MNKNINNAVELTEKELACVCGGKSSDLSELSIERIRKDVERRKRHKRHERLLRDLH